MPIVVFLVWFGAVLGATVWVVARPPRPRPVVAGSVRARLHAVVEASVDQVGRAPTAAALYLLGVGVVLAVCWPLGLLAHALEDPVDWPVFRWSQAHHLGGGWSDAWWKLTNIGKPRNAQGADAAAAVFFAVVWAWRRRPWWVPPAAFGTAYALEKYGQIILQDVVHRGHPPTTFGTYPSGGCARVLIVYGLVIFMFVEWLWPRRRRVWAGAAGLLALLWSIQAYARLNNLEHWMTDVVGGTVFGLMGLAVAISCVRVFLRPRPERARVPMQRAATDEGVPWSLRTDP
jgi:hypothetical protein